MGYHDLKCKGFLVNLLSQKDDQFTPLMTYLY